MNIGPGSDSTAGFPRDLDTASGLAEIVLSHVSERSVLHAPGAAKLQAWSVSGRQRLATCSGVSWFHGYHLAVVNLYGGHLRIYRLDLEDGQGDRSARLELLHETSENIHSPEDVAVSPDGKLLAITHFGFAEFGISIHPLDPASLAPGPAFEKFGPARAFHAASFSPDSRHLAFTDIGSPGFIELVRISSMSTVRSCLLENRHGPLKPKGISFSHDGLFAAIAYAPNAQAGGGNLESTGLLSVHRFDMASGIVMADALVEFRGNRTALDNAETCTFLPTIPGKPYRILTANQGADNVTAFAFNSEDRSLTFTGVFAAGQSFPHGVDVSADGRFVAVTNYGNDTLCILRPPSAVPINRQ